MAVCALLFFTGCATSDSTLREQGNSEAYIQGFHDGRHSGMKEAGNYLEHVVKDLDRFDTDPEYRNGWLAGEAEGIRMQQQADAASSRCQAEEIAKESQSDVNAIGKEVMKDVDTSAVKSLEKRLPLPLSRRSFAGSR